MSIDHYSKNISLILEYIKIPIPKDNFIFYLTFLHKSIQNDNKNIETETFFNINNYPLFISNKIFSSLTKFESEFLTENEFISFYVKLYYGNFYDKAKLVFDMLDFSKKKKIKKEDCIIFLYQFFIKKNKYTNKENLQLINKIIDNFFNDKSIITFGEYVEKIQNNNSDLLFLVLINLVYYKNFRLEQIKFFYLKTFKINLYEKINYLNEYNYLDIYPIYEPSENLFLYFRKYLNLNQFIYYLKNEDDFDENLYELNRFEDNLIQLKEYNKKILKKDTFNLFKSNYEFFPIHFQTNIEPETFKSVFSDKNVSKFTFIKSSNPELKFNEIYIHINTQCMFCHINLSKSNKILSIPEIKEFKTENVYIQLIYDILFVFKENKFLLNNIFLLNKVLEIYEDEYFFCIYYINGLKPNILKLQFSNKNDKNKILKIFFQKLKFRKIEDNYNLMFEIANGAFGKIYYSLSKHSDKEFAIKKISKNFFKQTSNQTNIHWEIAVCQILSNIKHNNIIKIVDIYENLNENYIVFEFIKECLADYISTTWPKKNVIIKILYQLADAVSLLNTFGIIHKDLKISNILINDHSDEKFNIKLIDFGISKIIGKYEYLKETTGTLIYISPEVINKKAYNFKEDVWAFGIIAYYLYKHKFPFNFKDSILEFSRDIKLYQTKLDQTEIHLDFNKKCDKNDTLIINIINMCLNKQIFYRPYIEEILTYIINNNSIN